MLGDPVRGLWLLAVQACARWHHQSVIGDSVRRCSTFSAVNFPAVVFLRRSYASSSGTCAGAKVSVMVVFFVPCVVVVSPSLPMVLVQLPAPDDESVDHSDGLVRLPPFWWSTVCTTTDDEKCRCVYRERSCEQVAREEEFNPDPETAPEDRDLRLSRGSRQEW